MIANLYASALKSGAKVILSEDMNSGQTIAGIRIENPFIEHFSLGGRISRKPDESAATRTHRIYDKTRSPLIHLKEKFHRRRNTHRGLRSDRLQSRTRTNARPSGDDTSSIRGRSEERRVGQ